MVHDFNNLEYKGVREAVLEFCRENGISYVPIPDVAGTVIITKNWRDKEWITILWMILKRVF